jgi:tetratricopeptide (TPR) repeat protein
VTAQLIKTRDGYHLFSEVYDRGLEDIFATQDDIAAAIADALRVHLGSDPRNQKRSGAETRVPEAYEHYLQGLHLWNEYTPEGAKASLQEFRAGAEADPGWAPPYCMEAAALVFLCSIGYEAPETGFPLAEAAADHALELAPALGEAHMGKALAQFFYHWDFDAAEESFERALSLQPGSANVLDTFSMLRGAQGRWEESLALMERAVELNPLSPMTRFGLARSLMFSGRLDDAMAAAQSVLDSHPGFRAAKDGLAWCRLLKGDVDGAIETWESLPRETGDPYNAAGPRGVGYAWAGRTEDARAMVALLEKKAAEHPGIHTELDLAMVHVGLGEQDRALDYLERAIDARLGAVVFMPVYHVWRPLHSNPRFRALLERVGLGLGPVP